LFVSGDTDVEGDETDPELLAVPLLFKPFSIGDLAAAVTRALATTPPRRIFGLSTHPTEVAAVPRRRST
jgi:hypothetical protein